MAGLVTASSSVISAGGMKARDEDESLYWRLFQCGRATSLLFGSHFSVEDLLARPDWRTFRRPASTTEGFHLLSDRLFSYNYGGFLHVI